MANVAPRAEAVVNLLGCRRAVREWAQGLGCCLFVTLVFNRATTVKGALEALRDLHARVDRKLLGHDWCKRTGKRTRYVAVLENVDANLHIHLLAVPADGKWWAFSKAAVKAWSRIAPAGDVDITPTGQPASAVDYMLKKVRLDTFDRVRFSGDHRSGGNPRQAGWAAADRPYGTRRTPLRREGNVHGPGSPNRPLPALLASRTLQCASMGGRR